MKIDPKIFDPKLALLQQKLDVPISFYGLELVKMQKQKFSSGKISTRLKIPKKISAIISFQNGLKRVKMPKKCVEIRVGA